ncbi:MAG: SDR family NAD(P)-dependent oxidoreductase [Actinomycetota bacterium]|nr:SDR family NAD(P)-dependent oxidoreductase [Actinomycetota bacterium]
MSRPLDGQVTLVTGAGSGIGAEVTGRLAQQGAAIGVNGRSEQEVAGTIERITSFGARAVAAVGDVAEPDDPGLTCRGVHLRNERGHRRRADDPGLAVLTGSRLRGGRPGR